MDPVTDLPQHARAVLNAPKLKLACLRVKIENEDVMVGI
jgi:hypothetical protein